MDQSIQAISLAYAEAVKSFYRKLSADISRHIEKSTGASELDAAFELNIRIEEAETTLDSHSHEFLALPQSPLWEW